MEANALQNTELLAALCSAPGVSGREERVRELVRRELEPLCDELEVDPLGNLVGTVRGASEERLLVSAHMDEIGFLVTHVDEDGFLHFTTLGGFDPKTLPGLRVTVHGREDLPGVLGIKPVHALTDEQRRKAPRLDDFYVDVGLPGERVRELVRPGDPVTRRGGLEIMGELLCGKALDDRVGVFVLLEALRRLRESGQRPRMTLYAVASVQEEVGLRGARVAAHRVDPQVALALDTTLAMDVPFVQKRKAVTRLGGGTAIKAYDRSAIPNYRLVDHLRELAELRGIPHQLEVLSAGGTDTGQLQQAARGAAAGAISVPTRYLHTVIETLHPADVDASIRLLAAFLEEAEPGRYRL